MWHSFEAESKINKRHQVNQVVTQILAKNGYEEGKGLGRNLQGIKTPVFVPEKHDKCGLGYDEWKMGNLVLEQENKREKGFVPPLNEIFFTPKKLSIAQYVIHQDTIHSLDGEGDEIKDAIRRAKEDEALLNWTSEPIIDICVS
ncbi:hypothetical protein PIB30_113071, partial [Stylosanthes scabra]|nr:hypothetical protein [Stylosanthes scabra]